MTGGSSQSGHLYPSLHICFVAEGLSRSVTALVDTGFDGHLVVPTAIVDELPQSRSNTPVRTASGERVIVPIYRGTVELLDEPGPIVATIMALGHEYLLGLAILNHFRITFDHGQRIIVEP